MHPPLFFTENSRIDEDTAAFWKDFTSPAPTVVCHTSGSTGVPKKLDMEKSAMRYSAGQTVRFFGLDRHMTALLCLPVKYIGGRMVLVRAVVSGMRVYAVPPSLNPLKDADNLHLDFAAFTQAQVWEICHDAGTRRRFAEIGDVIIGGAPIDAELEKVLLSFPNRIYATYGMTDTVSHIALRRMGEAEYVKISPETVLETDAENCLRIVDAHFGAGPLQTNDVVDLLDADRFVWLGRRDFVINSGGVKLHPEQMEQKIRTLPGWAARRFFIASEISVPFGERPVLVVEDDGETYPLEELAAVLGRVEMPGKLVRVPRFVWTESGKLNRTETLRV